MNRKREMMQYILWGGLSAVLNVVLFQILLWCDIDYKIANIITLVVVKIFSYITNKLFVFRTTYNGIKQLLIEMITFIGARGFTFLVDFAGLIFLVEILSLDTFIGKCIMAVVVVIANYIISKKWVFRKE